MVGNTTGVLAKMMEEKKSNMQKLKNENTQECTNVEIQECKKRRSYALKNSTIRKLEELKLYKYADEVDREQIVDEAICLLYETKFKKEVE